MKIVEKILLFSLLVVFAACATGRSGGESVHFSHNDKAVVFLRDSIFLRDSVFVEQRSDTVFYERLRTVYRDRCRVDTFIVCDTLYKERVVTKERAVRRFPLAWILPLLVLLLCLFRKGLSGWLLLFLKKIIK